MVFCLSVFNSSNRGEDRRRPYRAGLELSWAAPARFQQRHTDCSACLAETKGTKGRGFLAHHLVVPSFLFVLSILIYAYLIPVAAMRLRTQLAQVQGGGFKLDI